ncbi:hypothetical protein [Janthinobacterium sp.]|uniref:hypothetical protein n=1 Tax=Janthinobacterium sp. TaxID=1871054 RepID=UPI0026353271|nr:hypothetical protein [Janthinobacterium sp.]
MNVTSKVRALLPLQRASHREIVSKDGALVAEVMSVVGVSAATELEALIVAAVNSHEALVAALAELLASAIDASPADPLRFTRACSGATETLLMAGAA